MDLHSEEAMLRALDQFVGEWTMTAAPPGGPSWPGEARVEFAWLDGSDVLVQHWRLDLTEPLAGAPTSGTSIIGCDAAHGTYVQVYTDDRGACRVYQMGLRDDEWTLHRAGPPFAQRFTGAFSADGRTISGCWELAEDDESWQTDFDVTYTRIT